MARKHYHVFRWGKLPDGYEYGNTEAHRYESIGEAIARLATRVANDVLSASLAANDVLSATRAAEAVSRATGVIVHVSVVNDLVNGLGWLNRVQHADGSVSCWQIGVCSQPKYKPTGLCPHEYNARRNAERFARGERI